MKKTIFTMLSLTFLGLSQMNAQVGIGTTTPDASAVLDVESNTKGFLPPRLTRAQRDAISSPANGLTIYNTTVNCLQWYIGNNTWRDGCGDNPYLQYPEGTVFCESGPTEIVEVHGANGTIWMDRNLGASQAATASNDPDSYGDLYQWGRFSDGHQCRNSPLHDGTTVRPNNITDNGAWDGHFITIPPGTNRSDWVTTQTDNAWNTGTQADPEKTTTDPCPTGYRLPTEAELNAERTSWTGNNKSGAFASPLKLPAAGIRNRATGSLVNVGSNGFYWSSTVSGTDARFLFFNSSNAIMNANNRANGNSVRCIKD